jgi:hypothetical protein
MEDRLAAEAECDREQDDPDSRYSHRCLLFARRHPARFRKGDGGTRSSRYALCREYRVLWKNGKNG